MTDDSLQERGAFRFAQNIGVLAPKFLLFLCGFHRFTQKLADPLYFGSKFVPPKVYDRILATFQFIQRNPETQREALISMGCLRAYGRKYLSAGKFALLSDFIDNSVKCFGEWALHECVTSLNYHLWTSSAAEGAHSVFRRGKNGGWQLSAASAQTDVVDRG